MLIKNSLIMSKEFLAAFYSLMEMKMPAKQCLEVSSCIEDILGQHQIILRARKAIADKYCSKDDEGKPLSDDSGNLVFENSELQKKCMEELTEIHDEEVDLAVSKRIKISATELMTPVQMKLLKDIIEIDESDPR